MKEWAKKFYASDAWHQCRASYIAYRRTADGGMCEVCHESPGFIVHHKILLTPTNINDPDVSLNWKNLQLVCKACHDKIHEYGGREIQRNRKIIFNRNGDPMESP